jgi:hypothetical protein
MPSMHPLRPSKPLKRPSQTRWSPPKLRPELKITRSPRSHTTNCEPS